MDADVLVRPLQDPRWSAFWFDGQLYERMRVDIEGKDIHIVPSQRLTEALNRLAASPGSR